MSFVSQVGDGCDGITPPGFCGECHMYAEFFRELHPFDGLLKSASLDRPNFNSEFHIDSFPATSLVLVIFRKSEQTNLSRLKQPIASDFAWISVWLLAQNGPYGVAESPDKLERQNIIGTNGYSCRRRGDSP